MASTCLNFDFQIKCTQFTSQSATETFAKGEKYLALIVNSPANMASRLAIPPA